MNVDAPATWWAGQPITVSWTVINEGESATPVSRWYDAVYLSRDTSLDGSDQLLGSVAHDGALGVGESYNQSLQASLPGFASGDYYLIVLTDSRDDVYEHTAENNNTGNSAPTEVTMPPPADLIVTAVEVPASGVPGQMATITWTVKNQGTFDAVGQWYDSIYLSQDDVWDITDPRIGMVQHTGGLAVGNQYTGTLTAELPGVVPGSYYVIVRTDIRNNVRESDEGNNIGVSTDQISMDVIELTLGVPYSSQLSTGTEHYYKVTVPAGEDLLITLDSDSTSSANELYVRYGAMPTRGQYDFLYDRPFQPDQEIAIPNTEAGVYYILLRGESVPEGTANYTIIARTLNFSIRKVTPNRAGNVGRITLDVIGARFKSGIQAELVDPNGIVVPAESVYFVDGTQIYVTFNLRWLTPGLCDLRLINPDSLSTELADAFEIIPGQGPKLLVRLVAPSSVRPDRDFTLWLEYTNAGDVDMIPPIFVISSPNGAPMSLYPDRTPMDRPIQVFGVSFSGPPGVLRPGISQSIPIYSHSPRGGQMEFKVNSWLASDRPVSWDVIEEELKPADMAPDTWEAVWSSFRERMGPTWEHYLNTLAIDINLIKEYQGEIFYDIGALLQFELENMMISK